MRKTNTSVWSSSLFLMVLLSGITGLAHADTIIDTTSSWIGFGVNPFGSPDTETYGQTITVPLTDPVLLSWTFYMKQSPSIHFRGEVYAWNGFMATGPNLFESAVMTTTASDAYQPITFNTGGLALTPGDIYVLFASSSNDAQSGGAGTWEIVPGNSYTGGAFRYLNNGADATQWTTNFWSKSEIYDLAFKADFDSPAAVPEPSARILLATMLCVIFVLTRLGRKVPHA